MVTMDEGKMEEVAKGKSKGGKRAARPTSQVKARARKPRGLRVALPVRCFEDLARVAAATQISAREIKAALVEKFVENIEALAESEDLNVTAVAAGILEQRAEKLTALGRE